MRLTLGLPYRPVAGRARAGLAPQVAGRCSSRPRARWPTAPFFENAYRGADVDLWRFPTPRWHEDDGGRYIGTGDLVITRDPDDGRSTSAPTA